MANDEEWRPLIRPGTSGYEVSDFGRVRNSKGKVLSIFLTRGGENRTRYRTAALWYPEKKRVRRIRVATLVADAFLRPRLPGEQLEHEDQNSLNDRLDNLTMGLPMVASRRDRMRPAETVPGNEESPLLAGFPASRTCSSSGEGEIRTRGEVTPTPVFKTGAIGHSATSPGVPTVAARAGFRGADPAPSRRSTMHRAGLTIVPKEP